MDIILPNDPLFVKRFAIVALLEDKLAERLENVPLLARIMLLCKLPIVPLFRLIRLPTIELLTSDEMVPLFPLIKFVFRLLVV